MATAYHNLSEYDIDSVPSAEDMKFGIVVSEWNENITAALLHGAEDTLKKHGAKPENITVYTVPGSFELIYGSAKFVQSKEVDAVIALGCVVRGDTPHFSSAPSPNTYSLPFSCVYIAVDLYKLLNDYIAAITFVLLRLLTRNHCNSCYS
mgnify:CR=1 FL=1